MPKRRIAMISFHSCPLGQLGARDVGGMNVYVRELARGLGALGYMVDIFTRTHDPHDPQIHNPYNNVRLIHVPAGRAGEMDKAEQYTHLGKFVQNMARFINSDGACYDLIHSHYWLSGLVGHRLSATLGVPQVVMFHTLGMAKNSLPVGGREPDVRITGEADIARICRHIVASTEEEKARIVYAWGVSAKKISVVPCGIDTRLFRPTPRDAARRVLGFPAEEKVILWAGRIEPLKGLERLVEALGILRRSGTKLIIAGGDEHNQEVVAKLRSRVAELGISGRVDFLGAIRQEDLPLYYSAADLTAVASYYESFCLVILESLACGTPVVSTRVGVAPSIIGDSNGFISDGSPHELAQAMERVLNERRGHEETLLIRAGAIPYDWSVIAERIGAVYEASLSSEDAVPASVDDVWGH